MVEGSPLEGFRGNGVLYGAYFFFCVSVKERRKHRQGEGEQERLFSFGIWILGHIGPGVSQSGQSEGGGWAGGPRRAD